MYDSGQCIMYHVSAVAAAAAAAAATAMAGLSTGKLAGTRLWTCMSACLRICYLHCINCINGLMNRGKLGNFISFYFKKKRHVKRHVKRRCDSKHCTLGEKKKVAIQFQFKWHARQSYYSQESYKIALYIYDAPSLFLHLNWINHFNGIT